MELERFTQFGEHSIRLAEMMIKTLADFKVKSVSAPEININEPIIAIKSYPGTPIYIAFNPKIVYYGDDSAIAEEECFSYPGLKVKIKRPYTIRTRFQDPNGTVITKQFDGAVSRLFQHEMTHIEGRIFWNDANFINKNRAIKDWKRLSRKIK